MRPPNLSGNKNGYIALISTVIIAIILMTITFALGFRSFFARINVLDSEFKEKSIGLAEACADTAILKLQALNDDEFGDYSLSPPGETIPVGDDSCIIYSISGFGTKIIQVQGKYPQTGNKISYTNLRIVVSKPFGKIEVESWEEIGNFP
ncbi:MAG: hypothetical protein AAB958_02765 [Patescibacteria group bacterium]